MTATITTTSNPTTSNPTTSNPTTSNPTTSNPTTSKPSLVRAGVVAGLVAAVATTAVAAIAHAAGVSLETAPGEQIPVLGFAQLTLFFTAVGVGIAAVLRRRSRNPQRVFVRTTVVLTALSIVPDLMLSADAATKVILIATHLLAAAIVIPMLSARLPQHADR